MSQIPPVIHATDLITLLQSDARVRLLDVRTPAEFETQHIRGSYNVPLDTLGEHAREIRDRVDDPVVLVCRSGQRARRAEAALREAGMANLHVLDMGMTGWTGAGLPVVEGRSRMSLERQVRIAAGALAAAGGALALAVSPAFAAVPLLIGSGLAIAGLTDTCLLGLMLAKLPYNRPATCDVGAMVRALARGEA